MKADWIRVDNTRARLIFPLLQQTTKLEAFGKHHLRALDFPALIRVLTGTYIGSTPMLSTCQAQALRSQLQKNAYVVIEKNLDDTPCQ